MARTRQPETGASWMSAMAVSRQGSDDEEDVCRICRMPGEVENPLYFPCACSGSIKYVHQDCLLQWLTHSHARSCEVCKHAFSFSPVYAEDTPSRLPVRELVLGLLKRAGRVCLFLARLALVLAVWLVMIPFITCWFWRFAFARSLASFQALLAERFAPLAFIQDCVYGSFLSAGIVFVFLGATSVREYFRQVHGAAEVAGEQVGGDQGWPGGAGGNNGANWGVVQAPAGGGVANQQEGEVVQEVEMEPNEDMPFDELVGMQGPVVHLLENAVTVIASNAIFLGVAALLPFTLGRLVLSFASTSGVTGLLFGAIRLLSGKPPLALTMETRRNLLAVAAKKAGEFNTSLGGAEYLATGAASEKEVDGGIAAGLEILREVVADNFSVGEVNSSLSNTSWSHVISQGMVDGVNGSGLAGNTTVGMSEGVLLAEGGGLSDAGTVLLGYAVLSTIAGAYAVVLLLSRHHFGGRGAEQDVQHGVGEAVVDAVPEAARQVLAFLKYTGTVVKVTLLLAIELGAFPLACGWWLDVCTLSLMGASWRSRMVFLQAAPLATTLLHWLAGMVYMLQLSVFVSLMREVLRPGVLSFLRDPADPNYNPFRDLVHDPLLKHARRVALSVVLYGALIVLLVFFPVRLALLLRPSLFPLNLRFADPFTEVPADMLLFHICIPFTIEHFKPRATIKWVLKEWFTFVGTSLDLADFLLPRPGDETANPPGEGDPAVAGRLGEADGSDSEEEEREGSFAVKIFALVVAAWLTLMQVNALAVLVPVSVGRYIFANLARLPLAQAAAHCNDIYALGTGCYTLWGTAVAAQHFERYIRTHDIAAAVALVLRWALIVTQLAVLVALWVGVVPLLVGLLFELLVVVPLRVPVDESPVFLLYQDWALGLLFLKIWTRLVMLGQAGPFGETSLRQKFEQVRQSGVSNLQFRFALQKIVTPVVLDLLTALCGPYVVARGVLPMLGVSPWAASFTFRYIWSICLVTLVVFKALCKLHKALVDLHDSIRDDRYLVGRRLHNFGHALEVSSPASQCAQTELLEGSVTQQPEASASQQTAEVTSLVQPEASSQSVEVTSHDSTGFASGENRSFSSQSSIGDALFGVDSGEITSGHVTGRVPERRVVESPGWVLERPVDIKGEGRRFADWPREYHGSEVTRIVENRRPMMEHMDRLQGAREERMEHMERLQRAKEAREERRLNGVLMQQPDLR